MLLIAHRTPDLADGCAAIAAAGARVFEIDVKLDPSGRLIASHFLPLLNLHGWLENDGRRLRRYRRENTDPGFAETLALIPSGCDVLLDLKESRADRRQALNDRLIRAIGDPRGRFVVSTRNRADLERFRAAGVRTWHTIGSPGELRAAQAEVPYPDEAITVRHTLVTALRMPELLALNARVHAWTVNDPRRATELAALGVRGLTTDAVEVLRRFAEPGRSEQTTPTQ